MGFFDHHPLDQGISCGVYSPPHARPIPHRSQTLPLRLLNTDPLFAWDCLDDHLSLRNIEAFLQAIPDATLLDDLRRCRGRGRNDYPVHVLWGVVLLTAVLRHASFEACLAELRRNPSLRRLIGIDSEAQVPKKWNISRFLEVLGQQPHLDNLRQVLRISNSPSFDGASSAHAVRCSYICESISAKTMTDGCLMRFTKPS